MLTCHAVVKEQNHVSSALKALGGLVRDKWGIEHSTIQIEIEGEFDHVGESYGGIHGKTYDNDCCRGGSCAAA